MSRCRSAGLACIWIDRSSSSLSRAVQDAWDVCREELGVAPPVVVLALVVVLVLGDVFDRSDVGDFWSANANRRAGSPTAAGSHALVAGVLEAGLSVQLFSQMEKGQSR